jgi:IS30 family transposase
MTVKINNMTASEKPLINKYKCIKIHNIPLELIKSLTYDNGVEFHNHMDTNKALGTDSYFCNAYHSWEKGTNENKKWQT